MTNVKATPPVKKFKRRLSPFLCREMLYDYVLGHMDDERRSAVAECLESDRETNEALEALRRGLACAESLSTTKPAPELLASLVKAESALSLGRRYSRWSSWPETVRWSTIAVGISGLIAISGFFVPWNRLTSTKSGTTINAVSLAPIPGGPAERERAAQESGELPPGTPAEGSTKNQTVADASSAEQPTVERSGDDDEGPLEAPPPVAIAASEKRKSTPAPIEENESDLNGPIVAAPSQKSESPREKPRGFVYRAWLNVSDVQEITPKLTAAVKDLGGEKAGEVELGWRRGSGSYYHFVIPEKNESAVMERLKEYGRVRFSKDPHPRVMPAGQVRFILWVETERSR